MIYMRHGEEKGSATDKGFMGWSHVNHTRHEIESDNQITPGTNTRKMGNLSFSRILVSKRIDAYPSFTVALSRARGDLTIHKVDSKGHNILVTTYLDAMLDIRTERINDDLQELLYYSYTKIEQKFYVYDKQGKPQAPIVTSYDLGAFKCT